MCTTPKPFAHEGEAVWKKMIYNIGRPRRRESLWKRASRCSFGGMKPILYRKKHMFYNMWKEISKELKEELKGAQRGTSMLCGNSYSLRVFFTCIFKMFGRPILKGIILCFCTFFLGPMQTCNTSDKVKRLVRGCQDASGGIVGLIEGKTRKRESGTGTHVQTRLSTSALRANSNIMRESQPCICKNGPDETVATF